MSLITVNKFLNAKAKDRAKMLEENGMIINFVGNGRKSDFDDEGPILRKIKVTHVERDDKAFPAYAVLRLGGFMRVMPDRDDSVVLNDPSHKDKSFKFEWYRNYE